ncbi:MAG: DMT family transporter [Sciscionella sp.]
MLGVVFAVLAALANATASVLQRRAARTEPVGNAFSVRLLFTLVRRPVWIAGILTVFTGFLLQVLALDNGSIALVQPILVMELPFTLVLASRLLGGTLHRREWLAVLGMSAGLAVLLGTLAPGGGDPRATPLLDWVLGLLVTLALVATLVTLGTRARGAAKTALLGAAAGVCFGTVAVLVKAVSAVFPSGILGVLSTWQTYAVLVLGPVSFVLLQHVLASGRLVASQPPMTLANPLVAMVWGVALLGEHVREGPWLIGGAVGAVLITAATLLLARSPLLDSAPSPRTPADT